MKRALASLVVFGGCAAGGSSAQSDADPGGRDARRDAIEDFRDAPTDGRPDARPIDARPIDAPPPDACVPQLTELLTNPVFDLGPIGAGWNQTVIDPAYPLITGDDGVPEHSAPYKAWLGGLESNFGTATDVLFQDVTVPANTTQLVLTGFYEVRTAEAATDTNVYDTASVDLTQPNGTPILSVLGVSNRTPTTTWTAINQLVAQNLAGMTVRVRMTSSNDFLNATSFYFDTLSLKATHCP